MKHYVDMPWKCKLLARQSRCQYMHKIGTKILIIGVNSIYKFGFALHKGLDLIQSIKVALGHTRFKLKSDITVKIYSDDLHFTTLFTALT